MHVNSCKTVRLSVPHYCSPSYYLLKLLFVTISHVNVFSFVCEVYTSVHNADKLCAGLASEPQETSIRKIQGLSYWPDKGRRVWTWLLDSLKWPCYYWKDPCECICDVTVTMLCYTSGEGSTRGLGLATWETQGDAGGQLGLESQVNFKFLIVFLCVFTRIPTGCTWKWG